MKHTAPVPFGFLKALVFVFIGLVGPLSWAAPFAEQVQYIDSVDAIGLHYSCDQATGTLNVSLQMDQYNRSHLNANLLQMLQSELEIQVGGQVVTLTPVIDGSSRVLAKGSFQLKLAEGGTVTSTLWGR